MGLECTMNRDVDAADPTSEKRMLLQLLMVMKMVTTMMMTARGGRGCH